VTETIRLQQRVDQLEAQLAATSALLAVCQSDALRELAELAVKDPVLWGLVAWAGLSILLWVWRMGWYLSRYHGAFPVDRSDTI
jgi:hypothetical protein